MINTLISATAEAATAEAVTAADVVEEIVNTTPEEAVSEIGGFFQGLLDSLIAAIPTVIIAIIVLIIGMLLTKLSIKLMSKGMEKAKVDLTVIKFAKQCVKIVLYVLVFIVVLSILGIPTTSVITVIGTAGVAIGLALQGSLSNVAGGFILMLTKPFKIGDYILVSGVEGEVAQISILHTRLTSATNQAIFIPNSSAVGATVTNNSANGTRRVDLTFGISYEDDFATAQKIIFDVLAKNEKVLKTPEATVRMLEHGKSAIVIAVRPWCNVADYWDVYFEVIEGVRAAFIENNIAVPVDKVRLINN